MIEKKMKPRAKIVRRSRKKSDRQKAIEFADDWFSRYIRIRDSDDDGYVSCVTCGKTMFVKDITCGHCVSRRVMALRFDEFNADAQCGGCNGPRGGDHIAHLASIRERRGDKVAKYLLEHSTSEAKMTVEEIMEIGEQYKAKVEELLSEKMFGAWW